jgi:hypothetical protein
MSSIATPFIPASRSSAAEPCSPELAASALQRMKGWPVTVEGIDDCVVSYLTGLSAASVEGLVRGWNPRWGFPTASRLAALKDRLDGRRAPPTARTARDAA